jgi:hypothetical protein
MPYATVQVYVSKLARCLDQAGDSPKHRDARIGVLSDRLEQELDVVGNQLGRERLLDHCHVGGTRMAILANPFHQEPEISGASLTLFMSHLMRAMPIHNPFYPERAGRTERRLNPCRLRSVASRAKEQSYGQQGRVLWQAK